MAFEYKYEEPKFELIPDGEYEATLSCERKQTTSLKFYLQITAKIRNDVEQDYQGRLLFDRIYREKANPENYISFKINQLMSAIGAEKGLSFQNEKELINYINGKNCRIVVSHAYNDYYGDNENIIKFKKSEIEIAEIKQKEEQKIVVNDDDFPF